MKKLLPKALKLWLPMVVALTGVFGFAYIAVQQNYRQSLNDPQIGMAEDAAAALSKNYVPESVVVPGPSPIDMTRSLATWMAVYDAEGRPVASTALLEGELPRLPSGLFDPSTWAMGKHWETASGDLETRVTWQPRPNVRQAVVFVRFNSVNGIGYVAVGRSMRTTEERVIGLTQLAATAWGVTVLATLASIIIVLMLG